MPHFKDFDPDSETIFNIETKEDYQNNDVKRKSFKTERTSDTTLSEEFDDKDVKLVLVLNKLYKKKQMKHFN